MSQLKSLAEFVGIPYKKKIDGKIYTLAEINQSKKHAKDYKTYLKRTGKKSVRIIKIKNYYAIYSL